MGGDRERRSGGREGGGDRGGGAEAGERGGGEKNWTRGRVGLLAAIPVVSILILTALF